MPTTARDSYVRLSSRSSQSCTRDCERAISTATWSSGPNCSRARSRPGRAEPRQAQPGRLSPLARYSLGDVVTDLRGSTRRPGALTFQQIVGYRLLDLGRL